MLLSALPCDELEVFPSEPTHFRDKAKFQVSGTYDNPVIGFLNPETLKVENEILCCPLHSDFINQSIEKIKPLITKYKLVPYDIHTKKGELKGIILFHSPSTNQSYLRFILRSKESLDRLQKIVGDLPEITSISANLNPTHHAILEGQEEIYFKSSSIEHQFNENSLFLSPQGFVQTNTNVAQMLYQTARLWTKDLALNKICDLYCGHGPFSFHLEKNANEVLGIEVNEEAINMAKMTQNRYQYRSSFIAAKSENIKEQLSTFKPDLVVVNPPRAGLNNFGKILLEENPKFILYSSCNVETLSKDFDRLARQYQIRRVGLFDMFPHSKHFETLVLLESSLHSKS